MNRGILAQSWGLVGLMFLLVHGTCFARLLALLKVLLGLGVRKVLIQASNRSSFGFAKSLAGIGVADGSGSGFDSLVFWLCQKPCLDRGCGWFWFRLRFARLLAVPKVLLGLGLRIVGNATHSSEGLTHF